MQIKGMMMEGWRGRRGGESCHCHGGDGKAGCRGSEGGRGGFQMCLCKPVGLPLLPSALALFVSFPQGGEVKSRNVSRRITLHRSSTFLSICLSFSSFLSSPFICLSAWFCAGHWRSRSSRYRYSNVKPSFFRWPHFS